MRMGTRSKWHVAGVAALGVGLMALTGCGAAQGTPMGPVAPVALVQPVENPDVICSKDSENVGNRNARGTYGNIGDDNDSSCNVGNGNRRDDNVGNDNFTENNIGNDNGLPRRGYR